MKTNQVFWSVTNMDNVSAFAVVFSKYLHDCYVNCLYTKVLLGLIVPFQFTPCWSLAFVGIGVFADLPTVPSHLDTSAC